MQAIESIDDVGRLTRYPSIQAAERAGFTRQTIHACLAGRLDKHRGLRWRYAGDEPPEGVKPWIDGLHRMPAFVAEKCTSTDTGRPVSPHYLAERFRAWLPEGESVDNAAVLAWMVATYTDEPLRRGTFWPLFWLAWE